MHLKNATILLAIFLFVRCSIPNPDDTIKGMEQYWDHFKAENYDSLRAFYIPKGNTPEQKLNDLMAALHNVRERFGKIDSVRLLRFESAVDTKNGKQIDLDYVVFYEKKPFMHQFKFIKN